MNDPTAQPSSRTRPSGPSPQISSVLSELQPLNRIDVESEWVTLVEEVGKVVGAHLGRNKTSRKRCSHAAPPSVRHRVEDRRASVC